MPARAAACLLAVAAAATVSAPSPCAGFVLLRVDGRAPRLHGAWRRSVGEMPPDAAPLVATRGWHQDPATRARAAGSSLPDLVAPASVGAAEGAGAFAQCCRACSEWRALEPQLGALERQLAAGHARSDVVAAALAAARRVVLRPALLAALELRDWRSGGGGRVRGDESMQAGYEAAVLLWSREGWEQARDLLQQEADPPPTADLVRHFRATMRAVVGDVEDSYVETFTPAQEALPQGEGARYRAQAVTVDLSSAPVPDPAGASSLRQFFRVARDLLTGKVRKREWLRTALAGLLTRALSRRTAAPQLAVDMRSPAADAPVGAAEDVQLGASVVGVVGAVGAGGEDSVSSVGLGHAAMPAPAATELVEDELPELLIVPQRNGILSYDTRDPEQAAAAMAAVRRCNQPVVLKHVGQAQGWRALQSWTLQRLASEFAPAPPHSPTRPHLQPPRRWSTCAWRAVPTFSSATASTRSSATDSLCPQARRARCPCPSILRAFALTEARAAWSRCSMVTMSACTSSRTRTHLLKSQCPATFSKVSALLHVLYQINVPPVASVHTFSLVLSALTYLVFFAVSS